MNMVLHGPSRLVIVGGFLGAGKTSLVSAAIARQPTQPTGCITNDQAPDLVDSAVLRRLTPAVREVAGSCFCCDFDALLGHARSLRSAGAALIFAEAVGSCTDLAATVLRPMEAAGAEELVLAPLSVVVDPRRLEGIVFHAARQERLHESAAYIYVKQLEEAEIIVLNKVDTITAEAERRLLDALRQRFPHAAVVPTSAQTGRGIDAWLARLAHDSEPSVCLELDYDRYAEGEAALAWLNAKGHASSASPQDWRRWLLRALEGISASCRADGAPIAHAKGLARVGDDTCLVSVASSDGAPNMRGELREGTVAEFILNVRVQRSPAELEGLVRRVLSGDADVTVHLGALRSFSPPRPVPTHRWVGVEQRR